MGAALENNDCNDFSNGGALSPDVGTYVRVGADAPARGWGALDASDNSAHVGRVAAHDDDGDLVITFPGVTSWYCRPHEVVAVDGTEVDADTVDAIRNAAPRAFQADFEEGISALREALTRLGTELERDDNTISPQMKSEGESVMRTLYNPKFVYGADMRDLEAPLGACLVRGTCFLSFIELIPPGDIGTLEVTAVRSRGVAFVAACIALMRDARQHQILLRLSALVATLAADDDGDADGDGDGDGDGGSDDEETDPEVTHENVS